MTAAQKAAEHASSGSPVNGEPEYLLVGMLRRPLGLKGEMILEVITDFPERLKPGAKLFVGEGHEARKILAVRAHAQGLAVQLSGVDSPEAAGKLRARQVFVKSSDRPPLPAGTYYHHEIIGFDVVDEHEAAVGRLREILQTGANDVYVVARADGGETLLPVIADVVLGIDKGERRIRVRLMPGLIE